MARAAVELFLETGRLGTDEFQACVASSVEPPESVREPTSPESISIRLTVSNFSQHDRFYLLLLQLHCPIAFDLYAYDPEWTRLQRASVAAAFCISQPCRKRFAIGYLLRSCLVHVSLPTSDIVILIIHGRRALTTHTLGDHGSCSALPSVLSVSACSSRRILTSTTAVCSSRRSGLSLQALCSWDGQVATPRL
jgi:hypothetical protein